MTPLKVSTKLGILVACAMLFGATMIALSVRVGNHKHTEISDWDKDKKIEKTFSVQSGGMLFIDTDEGNITVTGCEGNEVSVRVIARGSDEYLKRFDVTFNQTGNTVRVSGKLPTRRFNLWSGYELDIDFEVTVPKNFNLNLHTSGGNLAISNLKGSIDGETSGGDLILSQLEGNVKLNTSGGNVDLQNAVGDFFLETSGGEMDGKNVTGNLHLETSGGNIRVRDSDGKLYASTSGGDIRVRMNDNKGIDLSTSGGNLMVQLPKSIAADVKAETSGGDVSCDFSFSGKLKDGSMNGKINGGGNLIRLETSGGDIVINSNE